METDDMNRKTATTSIALPDVKLQDMHAYVLFDQPLIVHAWMPATATR